MGYIFDALNKNAGERPAPEQDTPLSHEADDTTTLASVMASAQDADDQTPALRLSDIQPSIAEDIDEQSIPQAQGDAPPSISPEVTFNEHDIAGSIESAPTVDFEPEPAPRPKPTSLWARLLGKHLRGKIDDRLVAMTSPASAMSEEYRSIRTSILARHDNERHLVHTISSATPQEGKTITCVNLGLSFAELRNRNTVIIECDLRLPTFAKLLSCDDNKPGLIDYLRGDVSLKEVVQKIEGSSLHIIPAGGRVSDEAVQLLSSARMSRLIEALRTKYDHVIIDTPPVLTLADAGILGSQSEEVLLVARMRRTPRTLIEQAINTLTSYNAVVSGIIATDNPRSRGRGYGYKYGYRYGYGYGTGYGYTSDSRKSRKSKRAA